jgi:hypothetical protein
LNQRDALMNDLVHVAKEFELEASYLVVVTVVHGRYRQAL